MSINAVVFPLDEVLKWKLHRHRRQSALILLGKFRILISAGHYRSHSSERKARCLKLKNIVPFIIIIAPFHSSKLTNVTSSFNFFPSLPTRWIFNFAFVFPRAPAAFSFAESPCFKPNRFFVKFVKKQWAGENERRFRKHRESERERKRLEQRREICWNFRAHKMKLKSWVSISLSLMKNPEPPFLPNKKPTKALKTFVRLCCRSLQLKMSTQSCCCCSCCRCCSAERRQQKGEGESWNVGKHNGRQRTKKKWNHEEKILWKQRNRCARYWWAKPFNESVTIKIFSDSNSSHFLFSARRGGKALPTVDSNCFHFNVELKCKSLKYSFVSLLSLQYVRLDITRSDCYMTY